MSTKKFLRKSRRVIAIASLALIILLEGAYIYISIRGESLLRDFKVLLERGLARTLHADVSIGDIKGGVFHPISLSNITLYTASRGGPKLLEIKEISINYRLLDVFFLRGKRAFTMKLVSPRFYLAKRDKREPLPEKAAGAGFTEGVEIHLVDGSVVLSGTDTVIIQDAYGSGMLSQDTIQLHDMSLCIYGIPLQVRGTLDRLYAGLPHVDLELTYHNNYGALTAQAEGTLDDLAMKGKLSIADAATVDVAGRGGFREGKLHVENMQFGEGITVDAGSLDLQKKEFSVAIAHQGDRAGSIALEGNFASWPAFSASSRLKHLPVRGMDISTAIDLEVELKQRATAPVLSGTLDSSGSVLNLKPCGELSMQFTVRKKAIEILGLKWGRTFRMVGKIELEPPYNIELIALVDGTKLEELAYYAGGGLQNVIGGSIKGRFEVEGPLREPVSTGHITAHNGRLGNIFFENAVVHLVGKGPMITVGDSRIYKEIGYLILSGEIDFKKLGKRNIFEDVVIRSDDQTIVWEGWDITAEPTTDELSLKKRINEELEVGIKAFLDDGDKLTGEADDNTSEVEFKYRIRDNESFKLKLNDDEEFLGVEHKVKF